MVSFLVRAPGATGGKVIMAGILVAASSKNKDALGAAIVIGYLLSAILLLAPLYTFVKPIRKENDVGARTPYGHIITMFACIAWTLFAAPTFYDNVWTVIINGVGSILQLGYVLCFIRYAAEEARRLPRYLLVGVLAVSGVLTVLVIEMVIVRGVWSTKFIGVIASALTGISYLFVLVDVLAVLKAKRASTNLDPLMEVLFNLCNAVTWAVCACLTDPFERYSGIPCILGAAFLVAQLAVYLLYRREVDDDDFGFEMRAMFRSPSRRMWFAC